MNDIPPGEPAIRVMMMPRDTNAHGTIFGGVILSQIDLAGAVEARRVANAIFVTVAMDAIVFKEPVFVGDLLSFYTQVLKVGRTSVKVRIVVVADRVGPGSHRVKVTEAEATYVAVDVSRRPIPIRPDAETA